MRHTYLILFVFSAFYTPSFSQDWLMKSIKKAVSETVVETSDEKMARLDSLDFQFAMTVNEGSNLFEVEQKQETLTKASAQGVNMFFKEESQKTPNDFARDSLNTAISWYEIRQYMLAEEAFKRARLYMESNDLTGSLSYLRCISSIGVMWMVQGRNSEAEESIQLSLKQCEENLGNQSVGYASNLNSLAKLYQSLGKYNEADLLFDQALPIIQKHFGEKSMQYAIILNNKAMLFHTMGRNEEALELMKKSILTSESSTKKLTNSSFDSRKFQLNQALLFQASGNFSDAESAFLRIKKVFESKGQVNNPEYASLLNQLAILYIQMNKMDLVEPLFSKSIDIYTKKFGVDNLSVAKVLNDQGNFYRMQTKFKESESALLKSIGIRKNLLGESHPDYVKSMENLGVLYWKMGDLMKAYEPLHESTEKSLEFVSKYFPPMSEAEKTKYWDILQPRFQRFYNYAIDACVSNPAILRDVFDYQLATKALLLNSTNKIKKSILSSGDQSLINEYISWLNQKEKLAGYYALSKSELQQQKIDLPSLEKLANASERLLSQKSSEFMKAFSSTKLGFSQIASLLGDAEVVLEMIRVRTFDKDFTDASRYMAMILTKNSTQPKMVVLDNGNQLETRYAKFYKNAIQQKIADEYSYEQYWLRIEPLVIGKKTIYLSPDGVYNQINLNTLKKKDGDFLLNRYDLVTIGNSKDISTIKQRKLTPSKKDAFLVGFPDYGGVAVPLPGTKVEVEGITKLLTISGYKTSVYLGNNATESALKKVKAPALMHIATHGYFLADADLQGDDALGVNTESARNNPLLRSGLLFAGASSKENNDIDLASSDNGILTAYEAMNLNLEGTDLIILSACETGLGDVKSGEGVYGLQRAFIVAGANALVMSLWKVDDAATQQLMTNFYTNWTKGGNKLKAFKLAQQQLMTKFKEPYYWGAFVMIGI